MTETETDSILQDIQDLQEGLERLKLKVERRIGTNDTAAANTRRLPVQTRRRTGPLQIGEEVIIKNPKRGQEKFGTVEKIHASGWITVSGWKEVS